MKEGREPFRLLFAWPGLRGRIFGEAVATVTRRISKDMQKENYNFAFVLHKFRFLKREIPLNKLPLPKHAQQLIKLNQQIQTVYKKQLGKDTS